MAHKGHMHEDVAHGLRTRAHLKSTVLKVVIELIVVVHPHLEHVNHLLFESNLVHEDDGVGIVAQEGEELLESAHGHIDGRVWALQKAEGADGCLRNDLIHVVLYLDGVLDCVARRKLHVDALIGFNDGIELGARNGVEEAVDLVLEHVLGEHREHCHRECCWGGYESSPQ